MKQLEEMKKSSVHTGEFPESPKVLLNSHPFILLPMSMSMLEWLSW